MAYRPTPVPEDCPRGLRRWLADELRRVAAELSTGGVLRVKPRGTPPQRPQEGMIAYADGTAWNPGSGAGFYGYEGGSWQKLT